jgi:quinol monooxygenase YgiN
LLHAIFETAADDQMIRRNPCRIEGQAQRITGAGDREQSAPGGGRMNGFGLVVRFELKAGHERSFDELVATTLAGIRDHQPATLVYASHEVRGEPRVRVFYELYRDRAAFDAHESQDHVRQFLASRGLVGCSTVRSHP